MRTPYVTGSLGVLAVTILLMSRSRGRPQPVSEAACAERALSGSLNRRSARQLAVSSAALAGSVLADSALEHYRGGLYNPAMLIAPAAAALTLEAAASAVYRPIADRRPGNRIFTGAALAGLAGFGFHLYNLTRQTGGWNWINAFHRAPIGAPIALNLAGLLGLAASRVADAPDGNARFFGVAAGRVLALGIAGALVGTAAEAGLLHVRGAFQNRYMYLPVTLPPVTAVALVGAALSNGRLTKQIARLMLRVTALLGVLGIGFHTRGVARRMGGWRNWTQNLQSGPPLPAPTSFTGLALAGLAALNLLSKRRRT